MVYGRGGEGWHKASAQGEGGGGLIPESKLLKNIRPLPAVRSPHHLTIMSQLQKGTHGRGTTVQP